MYWVGMYNFMLQNWLENWRFLDDDQASRSDHVYLGRYMYYIRVGCPVPESVAQVDASQYPSMAEAI